nr:hypothetical protein 15 [Deltaproteobacteria bacterium]
MECEIVEETIIKESVVLQMSIEEARTLEALTWRIAGSSGGSRRKHTETLGSRLRIALRNKATTVKERDEMFGTYEGGIKFIPEVIDES